MTSLVQSVTALAASTTAAFADATSTSKANTDGSILEGWNPAVYNPTNPIILFIIQAGLILIVCRALHYPLGFMRQPRVVGEVLGGIILGPTVLGRIPGFTSTIFPAESIPVLNNVANLGLILFLFIIGLEVDLRYFFSNYRAALSISLTGMILPFGLGAAVSRGLYKQFSDEPGTVPIKYSTFALFVGIAMAITAFPVLCRILTELKLLGTPVGVITLASGVGDDVMGWVLLALCVALVNAGSGIHALYIILCTIGFVAFLALAVRPAFTYVLRRTHSLQDGPTQGVMVLTVLMCLGCAFFTGVIGVHPIFGAFLAGLICPHEGGFAIKVTEKIEDLMSALFLPLYFTLSGLNTNLGLLNNGITWAYLIAVLCVAFTTKFVGCACAARANGMVWRESFAIGSLMSCKGLVELIVLNIGLQAKILSPRVFTMFVVMALITTFATTPLTSFLYPPWYQRKLEAWKRGEIDWDSGAPLRDGTDSFDSSMEKQTISTSRFGTLLIYLRLDNMPNTLAFVSLFGGKSSEEGEKMHPQHNERDVKRPSAVSEEGISSMVRVHGMRIVQLTARTTSVMKVAESDELSVYDPVLNAFRVLGQLYNLAVTGEVSIVSEDSFADTLTNKADESLSDLLLLPWTETGSLSEAPMVSKNTVERKLRSDDYSRFVSQALNTSTTTTAVFLNRGFGGSLEQSPAALDRRMATALGRNHGGQLPVNLAASDRSHHIFMPFFGGPDAHAALHLVLQLAENPHITATIVHFQIEGEQSVRRETISTSHSTGKMTAASIVEDEDDAFFTTMQRTLPEAQRNRVTFRTNISFDPMHDAVANAQIEVGQNRANGGDLLVVGRNVSISDAYSSCLGLVADVMVERDVKASLVVVQARKRVARSQRWQ